MNELINIWMLHNKGTIEEAKKWASSVIEESNKRIANAPFPKIEGKFISLREYQKELRSRCSK